MNTNRTGKKKIYTISRGYRLKLETHRLIKLVKEDLRCSHDKVLNDAVKLYYKVIKGSKIIE